MRTWINVAVMLFAGLLSCVPGNAPVRINNTFPMGKTSMGGCDVKSAKEGSTGGSLDAQAGGDYGIVLEVQSDLAPTDMVNTNGVNLLSDGRFNFAVDALVLTYKSVNPTISFEKEEIPISTTLKPGSNENRIGVDIIGDKAAKKLREELTETDRTTLLTVSISLRGHTHSGETMTTNVVTYPIEVRPSTATNTCMEPGNVTRTGPCGLRGGQDGSTWQCCTAPGVPAECP